MALPTTDIYLRSPYWITIEENNLDFVLCDLRIWTGDLSAEPVEADIRLRSTALDNITAFDLAEYARDFVEVTFGGQATSNAVFISYDLQIFTDGVIDPLPPIEPRVYLTGFDGYGMFQDGKNFEWYKQVMMSDTELTIYSDTNVKIPVKQKDLTGYTLYKWSAGYGDEDTLTAFRTVTGLTPVENTQSQIQQISSSYQGQYANRVTFHFDGRPDESVNIDYAPCTKYGYTPLFFVNRLGATQEMHMFGKSDVRMTTKSNKYKRNIISDNGSYDKTRHQQYILNKNGTITIDLNTGWKKQEENDTMIEMMLSEQIWLRIDSAKLGAGWVPKQSSAWTVPVNIKSEDTVIKNRINEKVINYSFSFEAAYDWINTVR